MSTGWLLPAAVLAAMQHCARSRSLSCLVQAPATMASATWRRWRETRTSSSHATWTAWWALIRSGVTFTSLAYSIHRAISLPVDPYPRAR
nr:hypothetical protein [Nitrosomonas communis]